MKRDLNPADLRQARHVLPLLIGGFFALVAVITASGFFVFGLLRSMEADSLRTIQHQNEAAQLLNDVEAEEDGLSAIFYELAASTTPAARDPLLQRLNTLQTAIARNSESGMALSNSAQWRTFREKAERFIAEGRTMAASGSAGSKAFLQAHREVIDEMANLAKSTFDANAANERLEAERNSHLVQRSLLLLGLATLLALIGAVVTVYLASRMLRTLRWQTSELALLSSRVMSDQEQLARRFSRDLHDHLGQTLSALEANLIAMSQAQRYSAERMEDCFVILKDAVEHVREFSQLLRPSMLDDFGIGASLQWLGQTFSDRMGIEVEYNGQFERRLNENTETQLFRIAQEALTNVARHAGASQVRIALRPENRSIVLEVSDNGKGLGSASRQGALGMAGMRARALTAGGQLSVQSEPGRGVTILAELPMNEDNAEDSNPAGR